MDYTQSPQNVVDATTGFRRHEDNQALPTVVSEKDINSLIWSLMEVNKAAGVPAVAFDETVQSTYTDVIRAIRRLASANIIAVNFASSPFTLIADHAGIVMVDCSGGNVVINLPLANAVAVPLKHSFVLIGNTANTLTVNRAGTNLIDGAASFVLSGQFSSRTISSNGFDAWYTLSNSGALAAQPYDVYSANTALTRSAVGKVSGYAGTAAATFTLPVAAIANDQLTITNWSLFALSVIRGGTSTIFARGVAASTFLTLAPGESIVLGYNGTSWFQAIGTPNKPIFFTRDVTSSRIAGGVYFNNTTEKLIFMVTTSNSFNPTLSLSSAGVIRCASSSNDPVYSSAQCLSLEVPPGASYVAQLVGCTIVNWQEISV